MYQKNETRVLVVSLVITLSLVAVGARWLLDRLRLKPTPLPKAATLTTTTTLATTKTSNLTIKEHLSAGEKALIVSIANPEKQAAVEAIKVGDYQKAISKFEAALKVDRNDPEILIYLNNARIGGRNSYLIAVSVPIGSEVNAAKEMLRGVAQAQHEINKTGGIKGIPLKVIIADDNNHPEVAKKVAVKLVNKSEVLGVVGHYASDITIETTDIYQSGELVAISPISTSVKLSGLSNYVFRTVPSDYVAARALADYMLRELKQYKAAVFFNSQSGYSHSLKSEFVTAVSLGGGQIISVFDLSDPNFSAAGSLEQAIKSDAQVLMLATDSSTLDKALQVVKVNRKRLSILGGDDVYTPKTLEVGAEEAENMIVAIPWHILGSPSSEFTKTANQLWAGEVNWRSALSYDATKALITAIKANPSRTGVQQALSASTFYVNGASGMIRFLPSGDRNQGVQLVKIQPGSRTNFTHEFVPVP
ncbi:MAG: ABC transporter substrate-binding protein [Symploca sp. SIO1C4]|uniref:ABC transporter substrate-binding protein n=1 Tax=Symploca sp. SIO1C4 TaxID=2607765 RepID=A0A6B3NB22_9CYAN|nr:ABC transporter substrate-binding protein [Symploca sp. SIO1C4]NET05624.1 ABC transporter substrate-binding protein [Symploca sp. SIO2B6]